MLPTSKACYLNTDCEDQDWCEETECARLHMPQASRYYYNK